MDFFDSLTYIIAQFAYYLIVAIQFCMFARAILSWVMPDEDSTLLRFLYAVTEPVIFPVRAVLDRINFFRGFPFDMSFMLTFILLSLLETALLAVG